MKLFRFERNISVYSQRMMKRFSVNGLGANETKLLISGTSDGCKNCDQMEFCLMVGPKTEPNPGITFYNPTQLNPNEPGW